MKTVAFYTEIWYDNKTNKGRVKCVKTTLRARLMRLCTIAVSGTGIILALSSAIASYNVSYNNNTRLGERITENCAASIYDEVSFLEESLSSAEVSDDGDSTFDRVSLWSDSIYHTENCDAVIGEMNGGDFAILPTAETDGEAVCLAAYKTDENVIIGELSYDYLGAYLDGITDTEFAFVTNSYGDVIVSSEEEYQDIGVNISSLGLENALEYLQNGENGFYTDASPVMDGKKALINYSPIGDSDYFIVYAADFDHLFESYYKMLVMLVCAMIVCITVSVFATLVVSKGILRPVTRVTDRLVKLSEGDLSSPCEKNERGDETQVLSDALQKTVAVLSSYITDIDSVLSAMSEGNLSVNSIVDYQGDFIGIKNSLDGIVFRMRETMTAINSVGGRVFSDSDNLSSGADLLAKNTANEAAAIQEITSMTEGIEADAEKNTQITEKASELLVSVINDINEGGRNIEDMTDAMTDIKEASDEIQRVIAIIEDIAFQTNILALNAAVEAARAGELGKGFAVVADEVRALAAKSSEAASDTMKLIGRSSGAVNKGAEIANKTKGSFDTISRSAEHFIELMKNISAASEEQTKAIREINSGLENITATIQSNTASAEESAAASLELKSQADILNEQVSRFKI